MKESPSFYNRIGMTLGQRGRYEEAVEAFDRAIGIKPDYAAAHHNRGLALWNLGRPEPALESYRTAIAIDPTNDEPWCGLAQSLAALERFGEADELLQQAVAAIPGSAKVHYNLGLSFERRLDWEPAAAAFRRAIENNPALTDAYVRLARMCLFVLDQPNEAVELLTYALVLDPENEQVKRALDDALEVLVR